MNLSRRNFLRGLLATAATAAIAPQVLVERVHGASDLTPQERDIAADVMGLRQRQWKGWDGASKYIIYPVLDGRDPLGRPQFSEIRLPRDLPEEAVRAILEARTPKRDFKAEWIGETEPLPLEHPSPWTVDNLGIRGSCIEVQIDGEWQRLDSGAAIIGLGDEADRPKFTFPPFPTTITLRGTWVDDTAPAQIAALFGVGLEQHC